MREMILGVCLSVTILLNGAPGASAAADGACVAPPPALGSFQPADGTKRLPDAPYVDAEGQDQPLAGLRGTGLVLNLWATWCPPCVEEMPALDTLAGEAPALGLRVLALSADREGHGGAQVLRGQRHPQPRGCARPAEPGGPRPGRRRPADDGVV
ncbi:MAG: TlpA family protein disulfide reductase [Defluviicoccus sp.]|nr:MAG: TlpA family protein disulfide reductase [Defluviicoccus sp.]